MYEISLKVIWLSKADHKWCNFDTTQVIVQVEHHLRHVHPRKGWPLCRRWASKSLMCGANRRGPWNMEKACLKGRVRVSNNHFQLAELWLEPCDKFRRCTIGSQFITYGNMINGIKCLFLVTSKNTPPANCLESKAVKICSMNLKSGRWG